MPKKLKKPPALKNLPPRKCTTCNKEHKCPEKQNKAEFEVMDILTCPSHGFRK